MYVIRLKPNITEVLLFQYYHLNQSDNYFLKRLEIQLL